MVDVCDNCDLWKLMVDTYLARIEQYCINLLCYLTCNMRHTRSLHLFTVKNWGLTCSMNWHKAFVPKVWLVYCAFIAMNFRRASVMCPPIILLGAVPLPIIAQLVTALGMIGVKFFKTCFIIHQNMSFSGNQSKIFLGVAEPRTHTLCQVRFWI